MRRGSCGSCSRLTRITLSLNSPMRGSIWLWY